MKPSKILSIILIFFSELMFSQNPEKVKDKPINLNTVFLELGGSSLIYSINYEHSFKIKRFLHSLNPRIGIANTLIDINCMCIPTGINLDFGKNKNFFQIGLNRTFDPFDSKNGENINAANSSIGLGYVRKSLKGFYFHGSLYYLIFDDEQYFMEIKFKSIVWPALGFGYSF